jgi:DNA-directed RNA polymerase subunit alpha
MPTVLSSTVAIKTVSENATAGVFEIEGLYSGYGLTIGNVLRRALLSSLEGAAVTQIKVKNAPHEFTTLPGLAEDLVELSLNLKKLRFRSHSEEPQVLSLDVKGEHEVTGGDIKLNSSVELVNPGEVIAHLTAKSAELHMEVTVEQGRGYMTSEARNAHEKLPVGAIAVDSLFSPVTKVNFTVEDMRVGERTDYNRLRLEIDTDGTVSPSQALHTAAGILREHFDSVLTLEPKQFEAPKK